LDAIYPLVVNFREFNFSSLLSFKPGLERFLVALDPSNNIFDCKSALNAHLMEDPCRHGHSVPAFFGGRAPHLFATILDANHLGDIQGRQQPFSDLIRSVNENVADVAAS
jgi:hypothetical protein